MDNLYVSDLRCEPDEDLTYAELEKDIETLSEKESFARNFIETVMEIPELSFQGRKISGERFVLEYLDDIKEDLYTSI